MTGKRDPAVVVAIWAAVAAVLGALITTGGGLLSGLLSAGPATTVIVVRTETVTVQLDSAGVPPAMPTTTAGTGAGLSLRELPPQGARYFTYAPQSVAGVRHEVVLTAPAQKSVYRQESYLAPADRSTFRATIGVVDGAPPDSTGTFVVIDHRNNRVEETVLAGKTDTIEAMVVKGWEFTIAVLSRTGASTLAWINPVLLP